MTKRLTITLVALALFVLIAVLPASAILVNPATGRYNGSTILGGTPVATVFIGEDQLNLTPVLTGSTYVGAPESWKIGWWAPGTFTFPANPSQIIDVQTSYTTFAVSPGAFGPYTGTWYCLTANATRAIAPVFIVADPSQLVAAIDVQANNGQGQDMTGKSVVRGSLLTIKVDTNIAAFTAGGRSNNITLGWMNGTALTGTADTNFYSMGGGVGVGTIYQRWYNSSAVGNGGCLAANDLTACAYVNGLMLRVDNYSIINMTYSNAQVTRAMWFNNSIPGAAQVQTANNLTTDNGGLTVLASSATDDVLTPATFVINTVPALANGDGFITIKLKDESGQVFTRVYTNAAGTTTTGLANLWVNLQPWYLGTFNGNNGLTATGWVTNAVDAGTGMPAYPSGTYTVWTETTLSHMKDNYKLNGADYTGKTLSASGTVTLVSDTVKIEANKETVVRSKPFSVTITGRPLTTYYVWVKGTSSMTGGYDSQPPMVNLFQDKVYNDTARPNWPVPAPLGTGYNIGRYVFENSVNGRTIRDDVAQDTAAEAPAYNKSLYYCLINTSSSGTRTVELVTTNMTKAQTYTIRVEQNFGTAAVPDFKSDEVDVKVEKGAVTITAAGDQSYYLGEEVKFSGTNTETQTTYLFITGPNLWPAGSRLNDPNMDPRHSNAAAQVTDQDAGDFVQRAVNADNTWDWKWGTANWALDAGTYTIYAVSGPRDADHLANVAFGTVSIIIKKPFVSATASQSTVAQGDKFFITGTAEGKPQMGIALWILGKNYALRDTESVNSDASFSYEVTTATTTDMDAGQYFIVAQHPMQNQQFDIDMCSAFGNPGGSTANDVCNGMLTGVGAKIFALLGAGSLQGTDAAEALVQGINDANVDDTYTKLQVLIEVPVIRIDAIGDRHVGDKFTITATTNLAVDDEVLFEVYSSSFKPTQKTQSGEFSGATGTVKVTKGETGLNALSFDVDASTFKPDEYIVTASRVLRPEATATALFNVLEGVAPTATPTGVATTAAPTGVATTAAVPTTVPPTPTKTPTQPGFGALVALIGLGAVAFLVVRKH